MFKLDNAMVQRGGVTARSLTFERLGCAGQVGEFGLALEFAIASKGGGYTSIRLTVAKSDIGKLLREIAIGLPEGIELLSTAITTAEEERQRRLGELVKSAEELVKTIGEVEKANWEERARTNSASDDDVYALINLVRDEAFELIESLRKLTGSSDGRS